MDVVRASVDLRQRDGDVAERDVQGRRRLAGETADRQAVAAVGGDGDVQHRIPEIQQLQRVVPGLGRVGREDQDAVVFVADAQFADGADHAVGDVPVRLAGRDLEATGQHGVRQGDDHKVARGEVVGAADDAPRLILTGVDLAPTDHLAV